VIAVGVLIPVTRLDNWLAGQWQAWFDYNPGLLLTGGIAALIYAYLVRFLAVALHTVESSLGKITPSMDDAARSLGLGQGETMRRVHVPMLRGSLLTAGLLVFVDVMKELPATLVMRPSISIPWPPRPTHWLPMNGWRRPRRHRWPSWWSGCCR
jgi:iron(III) transport system permease protein